MGHPAFVKGLQSDTGTSQTIACEAPVALAGATALGPQRLWGQSASERQSEKQYGLSSPTPPGRRQTEPGAQVSSWAGVPYPLKAHDVADGAEPSTGTQAGTPALETLHFSWHPHPVWHTGSHAPTVSDGTQPATAWTHAGDSTGASPASLGPVSPFRRQMPLWHRKPSGQAPAGPHINFPSTTLGL